MWISCEDRLPEIGEPVWLFCFEDYQQEGYFVQDIDYEEEGVSHTFKNMYDKYIVVTHWMPLPEPPKE